MSEENSQVPSYQLLPCDPKDRYQISKKISPKFNSGDFVISLTYRPTGDYKQILENINFSRHDYTSLIKAYIDLLTDELKKLDEDVIIVNHAVAFEYEYRVGEHAHIIITCPTDKWPKDVSKEFWLLYSWRIACDKQDINLAEQIKINTMSTTPCVEGWLFQMTKPYATNNCIYMEEKAWNKKRIRKKSS